MAETERFLVSARKYRPMLFHELLEQEHVARTLANGIKSGRLAHAYLFCGPRGVGKTTAARLLAKAINCATPVSERGDLAEPCRTCDSCKSFEEGRNLDITEIDAASHNGVDDIRALQEKFLVPPQSGTRKVYIIDEVHMLSTAAFNAFLKSLEEPPPYLLFIFATTEPQKVLQTILSRCQRFDFRRIRIETIVAQLKQIGEQEQITADEGSLLLLARRADGAMRDALSGYDQAVSLCGKNLVYDELVEALGVVSRDFFFTLIDHVAQQNRPGILTTLDEAVHLGYDLSETLSGLLEHLRSLLVTKNLGNQHMVAATSEELARFSAQATHFTEGHLLRMMRHVDDTMDGLRRSPHPRLKVELCLTELTAFAQTLDIEKALQEVDRLLKAAPASPSEPKAPAPAQPRRATESIPPPAPKFKKAEASEPTAAEPPAAKPAEPPAPRQSPTPKQPPHPTPEGHAPKTDRPSPTELFGKPALKKPTGNTHRNPPTDGKSAPPQGRSSNNAAGAGDASNTPPSHKGADDAEDAHPEPARIDLQVLRQRITQLAESALSKSVFGVLKTAHLNTATPSEIGISVESEFARSILASEGDHLAQLAAQALQQNRPPMIRLQVDETLREKPISADESDVDLEERLQELAQTYPQFRQLIESFHLEIVW